MSGIKSQTWQYLKLFRRSLIYQTKEFFKNSTLHGVRYIAESGRPIGEKFMWFCFTSIGAVTALVIIMSLWEKFQTNPTITGLDTDFHNQQVMFPTTIVCPEKPYDEQKLTDLAAKLSQHEKEDEEMISSFLKFLPTMTFDNIEGAFNISNNFSKSVQDTLSGTPLRNLIFQMIPDVMDMIKDCKYRDEPMNCSSAFENIYTEHGFCFAFNSQFISKISEDSKVVVNYDLYETDKKWSLKIIPEQPSKIFILSHDEYFGWDFKPQLFWEAIEVAEIFISKKNTYTTDDAIQLSIGQRKCIFSNELELTYFEGDYTFSSCMKECRMIKVLEFCNCMPPFFKPTLKKPICHLKDFSCLVEFKDNITNMKDCLRCELGCSKTVFNVEKLNKDFEKPAQKAITVEFLTWPIIRYKREVLFGWVDLLVSFGGIAGLFLGFSLLSGVEIIYYFTLRAFCMVYRNRDELYAIEEDICRRPLPRIKMSLKLQTRPKGKTITSLSKFDPPKKISLETQDYKKLAPRDEVKSINKWKRPLKNSNKPIIKQVKAVPRSQLEPPKFLYIP